MDEQAASLARKRMRTEAQKRQFAIGDYAKTQRVLDTCHFCWQDDQPPKACVVSTGHHVYLALPNYAPLVPGHCWLVPSQHHLTCLEAEDDVWDEIKNFMKCLMSMHAKRNHGVLFWETVVSLKHQRHSYIEAVPLPFDKFSQAPAYFKVGPHASDLRARTDS